MYSMVPGVGVSRTELPAFFLTICGTSSQRDFAQLLCVQQPQRILRGKSQRYRLDIIEGKKKKGSLQRTGAFLCVDQEAWP